MECLNCALHPSACPYEWTPDRRVSQVECNDFRRIKIRLIDPPELIGDWINTGYLRNATFYENTARGNLPPFTLDMAVDEPVRVNFDTEQFTPDDYNRLWEMVHNRPAPTWF